MGCPVLRRLTRDSEMTESHWFLPGPGQRGMAPPLRYAPPRAEAGVWHQAQHGGQVWAVTELCAAHPPPEENFRAAARGTVRPSVCSSLFRYTLSTPSHMRKGSIGAPSRREEGAESGNRFSPLIAFPAVGPGSWYVHGRNIPRRRVSLCSRARGKEESVEYPSCPSDSSQRAC